MSDTYHLIDNDGDLWYSEDGDLFTCHWVASDWEATAMHGWVDQTIDRIRDTFGIRDDGVTFDDVRANPVEALIQEVGTLIEDAKYVTKDSGVRAVFASGMQRDTEAGKARFDLLIPEGVPYADQFLTRIAELMARGAEKYEDRNWEQADSDKELRRMKSSAFRHFMEWFCNEEDEDHAAAAVFNLIAHETTKYKINQSVTNGKAA